MMLLVPLKLHLQLQQDNNNNNDDVAASVVEQEMRRFSLKINKQQLQLLQQQEQQLESVIAEQYRAVLRSLRCAHRADRPAYRVLCGGDVDRVVSSVMQWIQDQQQQKQQGSGSGSNSTKKIAVVATPICVPLRVEIVANLNDNADVAPAVAPSAADDDDDGIVVLGDSDEQLQQCVDENLLKMSYDDGDIDIEVDVDESGMGSSEFQQQQEEVSSSSCLVDSFVVVGREGRHCLDDIITSMETTEKPQTVETTCADACTCVGDPESDTATVTLSVVSPTQQPTFPYGNKLDLLIEMGFDKDLDKNKELLLAHDGNLSAVVRQLMELGF